MPKHKKPCLLDIIDPLADDVMPGEDIGDSLKVDIPCLANGYDWYQLLTVDRHSYSRDTAKRVSRDHLPWQGIVLEDFVINRLRFLNKPYTEENFDSAERELELQRQLITRNISDWIRQFVIFVANECGMRIGDNRIMSWADYMFFVEHELKTQEDAMLIMKSLFIAFQYLQDYKLHLTICISISFNIAITNASKRGIARTFVAKMITYRINQLRKQVNDACEEHNGYNFRLIRPRKDKTLQKGIPKYLSPWMIKKSEPTHQPKRRPSASAKRASKRKHRNVATYKKAAISSEEAIILELANVEMLRNKYIKQLNAMRDKKIEETGKCDFGPFTIPPSTARGMFDRGQENAENDDDNARGMNDPEQEDREDNGVDIEGNNEDELQGDDKSDDLVGGNIDDTVRISTKERLKQIALEERSQIHSARKRAKTAVAVKVNKVAKGKNTNKKNLKNTTKDKAKQSNKVSEEEWDIQPCTEVLYRERKPTTMKMIIFPEKIINVRKGKGWKLEVMVEYNTGETAWSFLHGAVTEMPQLTDIFMKDNNLNYSVCGYKDDPKLYDQDKEVSQFDDYKRHKDDVEKYNQQQSLIHDNLIKKSYVVHLVQAGEEEHEEKEIGNNDKVDNQQIINDATNIIEETNEVAETNNSTTNDLNETNIEIETNNRKDTADVTDETNEPKLSTIETNETNVTIETNVAEAYINNNEPEPTTQPTITMDMEQNEPSTENNGNIDNKNNTVVNTNIE